MDGEKNELSDGCEAAKGKARSTSDWTGNSKGVFSVIGASNHSLTERAEHDFYATSPEAVEMLYGLETFSHRILEPCCGAGHVGKVFEAHGHEVDARDLVYRGYGVGGLDFLECSDRDLDADVVTNPPYSKAKEFVEKSLEVIGEGHKVAMFLKLTFLEGKARRKMFEACPPPVGFGCRRAVSRADGTEPISSLPASATAGSCGKRAGSGIR